MDIECVDDLLRYLRETGRVAGNIIPAFTILEGGVSNRTVLVEVPGGRAFVLKQALERLRVATDWRSDPRRIEREALGLEWLARLAPPGAITPLLFLDRQHHLLGMEAVPRPHANWKSCLLAGDVQEDHVRQFGELLGTIHRRSREEREVAAVFADQTFFETLRLEPYYQFTAARVPEARDYLTDLVRETQENRLALVHGDYSPKNVLIHQGKLVLLDHEVIHFGDPAFDLGFSLTHFLSKANHLPAYRQRFAAAAACYWRTYCQTAGHIAQLDGFERRVVRHTLGCLIARVAGRSPLEYLNDEERRRQRDLVLALIPKEHSTVGSLLEAFLTR